jgi:diaminohydroxyphosphoribosylaminopyrimidine deaminase/5-amino-6-(5-phosphoribosylamino)uracil reductase
MAVSGVFFMPMTIKRESGAESVDEKFMREALCLAERGEGFTRPNPMVGAIVVRSGEVIGRGWHEKCGGPHAEVNAIKAASETGSVSGTTLYVTLEPCCHTGRTPPCVDLIIASGIAHVVCAMEDPNPLVAGKGITALKAAGIEVSVGTLERESRALNRAFVKHITTGLPYVILKSAISLDGKIATASGESKWISCEESREDAHALRARVSAIMTGIGTVLADDPLLSARPAGGARAQPRRIIVDTNLKIPLGSNIVASSREITTIIAIGAQTASSVDPEIRTKLAALEAAGVRIIPVSERDGRVDLALLEAILGKDGIDSLLIESGGTLAWGALEAGIVDRVRFYIAPVIIGGARAPGAIGGTGAESLAQAPSLANTETRMVGRDIVIEGDLCLPE